MNNLKEEHPGIISASRRSDIPAFYSDWIIKLFKQGSMIWKNPFNPGQKKIIYLDNTRVIVFWSKNPYTLIDKLNFFNNRGIKYYFQFTLNKYPQYLEPKIPSLKNRIDTFKKLVDRLGTGKVIWRFDPIILTDKINENYIYESLQIIGNSLKGYTDRLMVSFIHLYSKVIKKLKKAGIKYKEISQEKKINMLKNISHIGEKLDMDIFTCAEPLNINNELNNIGIKKGSCIDKFLMKKIFAPDIELMDYLEKVKKDKGQRKECGRIQSIDIGNYNTCRHHCLYCYA